MEKDLLIEKLTDVNTENKKELAKQVLFPNVKFQQKEKEIKNAQFSLSDENLTENVEKAEETTVLQPETNLEREQGCEIADEEQIVEASEVEQKNDVEVEKSSKTVVLSRAKTQKNLKTRLKIFFVAGILVLTCLGGWAIYNGIRVKTLTAELQAKNAEYSVNVAKVISNISKLDDLSNPNSITNLDELEKAEVIKIVPKNEVAPISYEQKSNWFDRLCNWLSNLFK